MPNKWKQKAKRARETANIYADNLRKMTDIAARLQDEIARLKQAESDFNLAIENAQAENYELKMELAEKSQIIDHVALYIDAITDCDIKNGKRSRVQKVGTEVGEVCNRGGCDGQIRNDTAVNYCNKCGDIEKVGGYSAT